MGIFTDKDGDVKGGNVVAACALAVMGLVTSFGSFKTVESGERGVRVTWGKVDEQVVPEGLNFKIPFIQSIETMSIKTQKMVEDKLSCPTKDLQNADVDIAINYSVDPSKVPMLYKQIGLDYEKVVIVPAVRGSVKDEIGRWEAQELTAARAKCTAAITEALQKKLEKSHIFVSNIELQNIEFEKKFNEAIEAKVVANQKVLEQQFVTEQKKEEARQMVIARQAEADGAVLKASAEAKAITVKAEAETKAIQMRSDAIAKNPQVLMLEAINRWNGELPTVMSGNTSGNILDVKSLIKAKDRSDVKAAINNAVPQNENNG